MIVTNSVPIFLALAGEVASLDDAALNPTRGQSEA